MFRSIDTELRSSGDAYTGKLPLYYLDNTSDIFYPNTKIDEYDPSYNKTIKVKLNDGLGYNNTTVDTTLIKSDGNVSDNGKFIYPIDASTVKIKIDLKGTSQLTPLIKDVMVIVSDLIIN